MEHHNYHTHFHTHDSIPGHDDHDQHHHHHHHDDHGAGVAAAALAAAAVKAEDYGEDDAEGVDNFAAAIVAAAAASVEEGAASGVGGDDAAAAAAAAAVAAAVVRMAGGEAAAAAAALAAEACAEAEEAGEEADDDAPMAALKSAGGTPKKNKKRRRKPYVPALPPARPMGYAKGSARGEDGGEVEKKRKVGKGLVPVIKLEQTESEWMLCYYDLKAYYETYGNCRVPRKGYDLRPGLHIWGQKQKREGRAYREGRETTMTPARMELLDRIGFEWHPDKGREEWDARYRELLAFHAKYGKIRVPERYDPRLHSWVAAQRRHYRFFSDEGPKTSNLDAHQVALLDAVGMQKRHRERDSWDNRFDELLRFKADNGHTNVPQKWKLNSALGRWVDTQKTQYHMLHKGKKTHLTIERIQKLINLGFQWR